MIKRATIFVVVFFAIVSVLALTHGLRGSNRIDKCETAERRAKICPDYDSTIIPPNIAPLNFMVKEAGSRFFVKIYSQKGEPIEIDSRSAKIQIPENLWHELLGKNRGGELHFDIFVRAENQRWNRFQTITNRIANEDIDGYIVYRRMLPFHYPLKSHIGIYQRNLANFDEKILLHNRRSNANCLNCHSFCSNRPDKMLMGVRINKQGGKTLFIEGSNVVKIDAKFGYTSWHPSGKIAAYSINNLPIFFHTLGNFFLDTVDLQSALALFDVDSKKLKTVQDISRKDRQETWPAWSGDGRYLYFCSAPVKWPPNIPPEGYSQVRYDLVRISYDIENDKWGQVETVLSTKDTGLSIAMPKASPDGRWLLFCMCDYGYFPPWQTNSDLYLMDLKAAGQTGRYEYRRLELNSDQSESWQSWSSNSRWIVFSSKRDYGKFTKCYIGYIDENGKSYKPLIMPMKDPTFYNYCMEAFNTPELVTGPLAVSERKLANIVHSSMEIFEQSPITMATPKAGAAPDSSQDYQELK
jgi:hypothetical protein